MLDHPVHVLMEKPLCTTLADCREVVEKAMAEFGIDPDAPNPVTVRLLDPPMHEFLPTEHDLLEQIENDRGARRRRRGH